MSDLTTEFAIYVEDLRDASLQAVLDSDTEIALDLADIRVAAGTEDDLNTAYMTVLSA